MTKEDIIAENPDFENNIKNLISHEGLRYFYHITPTDAYNIMEEGLFLKEKRLSSTTIELPDDFYDDPINYCLNERGHGYRENASVVILGIPYTEVDNVIERNYFDKGHWSEIEDPDYVIPSRYIAGFIDTNDFSINLNEYYFLINEYENFRL